MTNTHRNGKYLTLSLLLVFLGILTQARPAAAQTQDDTGQLTVVGMCKVNDKPAATGDTVLSGATVETAARSSAVVSLGKLGRVEAVAETKIVLKYDKTSISIVIEKGSVHVSTGPGIVATIARKDP